MKATLLSLFCLIFLLLPVYSATQKRQSADISKRKGPIISTETVKLTPERTEYCLLGGQTGNTFYGPANYMMTVWKNKIIYLGQSNGRQDFTAQNDTLKAMNMARGNKIVVAFGAMNKEMQPMLDEYLAGAMTQEEFFNILSGREDTNYDITNYKELLDFITKRGLRALAIGLPAALIDTIEEYGEEGLSKEERQLIPLSISKPQNPKYNQYIKAKLEEASGEKISEEQLKKHIHALAVLNESMAKTLADFLLENQDYAALVIVDNDRLAYNSGINLSANNYLSANNSSDSSLTERAQSGIDYTTIYIKHALICPKVLPEADKDLSGYIWYIDNSPLPEQAP